MTLVSLCLEITGIFKPPVQVPPPRHDPQVPTPPPPSPTLKPAEVSRLQRLPANAYTVSPELMNKDESDKQSAASDAPPRTKLPSCYLPAEQHTPTTSLAGEKKDYYLFRTFVVCAYINCGIC